MAKIKPYGAERGQNYQNREEEDDLLVSSDRSSENHSLQDS